MARLLGDDQATRPANAELAAGNAVSRRCASPGECQLGIDADDHGLAAPFVVGVVRASEAGTQHGEEVPQQRFALVFA